VNTRYENDLYESTEQEREISLSTTTILGIFFALALLCAVFFGFGYSMGRKSAQSAGGSGEVITRSENTGSKPAPGSPLTAGPGRQPAGTSQSASLPLDSPNDQPQDTPQSLTLVKATSAPISDVSAELTPRPASKAASSVPIAAALPLVGSSVVQVAAMSHQEDADVVAVDLKRRGYTVAIRHESQDKLFHVQIGPFGNKKEADSMRRQLQTDGYNNAIVK